MKRLALILICLSLAAGTDFVQAAKPSDFNLKEGDLISAIFSDDPDIYIINGHGYKRLFLNPEIFKFYGHLGGFASVKLVTPEVRDSFPTSGLFRNCEKKDPKVYGVKVDDEDKAELRWINTTGEEAVKDDPDFFKKVFCINEKEFEWYPQSQELKSVKEVPQYSRVATPIVSVTPAIPAVPAVPASSSQPFAKTASTSAQPTPTPIPSSTPATPAIPATPTTPSPSGSTPTPTPTPAPTPESVAFAFSNQNVTNITSTSATIIFTTNKSVAAKAALFICTTSSSGGSSCQSQNIFWESPNIGFSPYTYISGAHSIPVSYLKGGTKYTFQVDVFDASYYTYTYKGDFTTPVSTEPPPVVSNVQKTNIIANSFTATWTTDKPSDSTVNYRLSSSWGPFNFEKYDGAMVTNHSVPVDGLNDGTEFTFRVTSKDNNGGVGGPYQGAAADDYTGFIVSTLNGDMSASVQRVATDQYKITYNDPDGLYSFYTQNASGSVVHTSNAADTCPTTKNQESGILTLTANNFPLSVTIKDCVNPFVLSVPISLSMPSESSLLFNRNLFLGSNGDDVKRLQALLVGEVNYPAHLITGHFGFITRDAVKRLQEKYEIKPVSGYFGSITRKTLDALVSD